MSTCVQLLCEALVGRGVRWRTPPEAETLLVFGRALEAANLPVFNIENAKKSQISFCVVLQK